MSDVLQAQTSIQLVVHEVAVRDRVVRLGRYSLEHRSRVGRFMDRVVSFNEQLQVEFSREEVLWGVLEWHILVGSTPWENLPQVKPRVRDSVVERIDRFLTDLEREWGVA